MRPARIGGTGDKTFPDRPGPQPRGAGEGAEPRRTSEGPPLRHQSTPGAADRCGDLRQNLHSHPRLLRRRHRRPGREPADHQPRRIPVGTQGVRLRHHDGAQPTGEPADLAHLPAAPAGGDGPQQPGSGHQLALRRLPPLPAAGRPADRARALRSHRQGLAGKSIAYLGDAANNMANSYLLAGANAGMDVRMQAPKDTSPSSGSSPKPSSERPTPAGRSPSPQTRPPHCRASTW